MFREKALLLSVVSALLCAGAPGRAGESDEPLDWPVISRLRQEGLHHSRIDELLRHLTDRIGPRLTGSPAADEASQWAVRRLSFWGLENAGLEAWGPFGRAWTLERSSLHMLKPRSTPLQALPAAWTPGTAGPVTGILKRATLDTRGDLDRHRGQLRGKIVLLRHPTWPTEDGELEEPDGPLVERLSDEDLEELKEFPQVRRRREGPRRGRRERYLFEKARNEYLVEEGVVAVLEPSTRIGALRVHDAGSRVAGESPGVPWLVVAAEQYNWMVRLVDDNIPVELELDVRVSFGDGDLMAANVVAEIPGTDLRDQLVLAGAHLDSWHAGTGASDNAAGCAVVMEALRLLSLLEKKPRRTIRLLLWTGEEQGLLGSRAYVARHFASREEPKDPETRALPWWLWSETGDLQLMPEHGQVSAYFNLDNGSGRIRGIYSQENVAVVPIFERWLEPFEDLGATTVTNRNARGTDHLSFDRVGLPGFQFIQDRLDYLTRTHHTNLDTLDHTSEEDLKQAAVILASFLYHAAMRDELLPRKQLSD